MVGSASFIASTYSGVTLEVVIADITKLQVDAIVNAANTSLLGGGGVDGAIHRSAGQGLLAECEALGGCNTGDAKITRGYLLPARYVIHAVGPVWAGGDSKESELLASCYRNALGLAEEYGLSSIAFPAISTGVYRFPPQLAANIAVQTVKSEIDFGLRGVGHVLFCCFSVAAAQPYRNTFAEFGLA
jgi:O-acetyl-ADP-ribose deacetylase